MNTVHFQPIATAFLLALAAVAYAQPIGVTVNGSPVEFIGAQPIVFQGRVLVPLRGVLEQMGAYVDWDPARRLVTAQKSGIDVRLPIGSNVATINGQPVALDAPATVIGGSTMVPLRFLGQALGADVAWDSSNRTVIVAGTGGTAPAPPPIRGGAGPTAEIASFTNNATGWLVPGSSLQVIMDGTPGGIATFTIPGVVTQTPMQEATPGHYVGRYVVPAGVNLSVSGAQLTGRLSVNGTQRVTQADNTVSIDALPPVVGGRQPRPGDTVNTGLPAISAVLDDIGGSGVDPASVAISVNGVDVTSRTATGANSLSYRPTQPLPPGQNTVTVTATDRAGNQTTQTWTFIVQSVAASAITSFTHSNIYDIQRGDVITVTMVGTPGSQASFALVAGGNQLLSLPMQEASPGVYQGQYRVRPNDQIDGAAIVGQLTNPDGQTYTVQSPDRISYASRGGRLAMPRITYPTPGSVVTSPLTITGQATPNTRVHLKVQYITKVLGIFQSSGIVVDQMLPVDGAGRFASQPTNLGLLIGGKNTTYTISVSGVGDNGQETQPVVLEVTGQ